jgi:hypothetical protein
MNRKSAAIAVFAIGLILTTTAFSSGGTKMKIALEDRLDTNPRQIALGLQRAGNFVGFVISWTDRLRGQAE